MPQRVAENAFQRVVSTRDLAPGGVDIDIAATAAECLALARQLGLGELIRLGAVGRLWWDGDGAVYRLDIHLTADVVQSCVVSLEPVQEQIDEQIGISYCEPPAEPVAVAPHAEIEIGIDEEDPPEPLDGDQIDVGAVVAEHLALALNPYPRAPGAVFEDAQTAEEDRDRPSPFAVLERLQQ